MRPTDAERLKAILDAIYVEDCHVTGMHDPTHTSRYICELQLRALALRVLAASHDVKLDQHGNFRNLREVNKVPRCLVNGGWYDYHRQQGDTKSVKSLERWRDKGVTR